MAVPAYLKAPEWSWWGGLAQRLRAAGFDPSTAEHVAAHVHRDVKPYLEAILTDREVDGTTAEKVIRRFLLGEA